MSRPKRRPCHRVLPLLLRSQNNEPSCSCVPCQPRQENGTFDIYDPVRAPRDAGRDGTMSDGERDLQRAKMKALLNEKNLKEKELRKELKRQEVAASQPALPSLPHAREGSCCVVATMHCPTSYIAA